MGLSISSVGNHEFDRGSRELRRVQRGGCHPVDGCRDGDAFSGARFQYLPRTSSTPHAPAAVSRDRGQDDRRGQRGLHRRNAARHAANRRARGHQRPHLPGRSLDCERAREEGSSNKASRAVVLLIHEGGRQGGPEDEADPNGCVNFGGAIETIARKLTPDIKVIVSGHSHRAYNCSIAGPSRDERGEYRPHRHAA